MDTDKTFSAKKYDQFHLERLVSLNNVIYNVIYN